MDRNTYAQDYYAILRCTPDDDVSVLKRAYTFRMAQLNPRINQPTPDRIATAEAQIVNEAWACLSDASKKQHYDLWYRSFGPGASAPRPQEPGAPRRPQPSPKRPESSRRDRRRTGATASSARLMARQKILRMFHAAWDNLRRVYFGLAALLIRAGKAVLAGARRGRKRAVRQFSVSARAIKIGAASVAVLAVLLLVVLALGRTADNYVAPTGEPQTDNSPADTAGGVVTPGEIATHAATPEAAPATATSEEHSPSPSTRATAEIRPTPTITISPTEPPSPSPARPSFTPTASPAPGPALWDANAPGVLDGFQWWVKKTNGPLIDPDISRPVPQFSPSTAGAGGICVTATWHGPTVSGTLTWAAGTEGVIERHGSLETTLQSKFTQCWLAPIPAGGFGAFWLFLRPSDDGSHLIGVAGVR
jgi:hypothetical protein